MRSSSSFEPGENDLTQEILGQFPFLNGYTHAACGFQLAADAAVDEIVTSLCRSVTQLVTQIPLLSGQVVHSPGAPGSSGRYLPAPWPASPPYEPVRVKDCSSQLPSFTQLARANVPIGLLGGDILLPCPGLPDPHGLTGPVPILIVQANFIRGGLILNVSTHHNILDACALARILGLLGTLLKGRSLSAADLQHANRPRTDIIPLLAADEPIKDFSYLRRPPGWTPSLPSSPFQWCTFRFPLSGLASLRQTATVPAGPRLSDDDILSAWVWQRVSAIRIARGIPPSRMSKYTRAIDGRASMGLPAGYLGHLVHHAISQLPLSTVASAPLAEIARTMRRDLQAANTAWALRSYATFLANEPDKSVLLYGGPRNPDVDLGGSSLLDLEAVEDKEGLSFGPLLGPRRFGRKPGTAVIPGCVYFQPLEANAIPLVVCLPEEDIKALKRDGEWRRLVRFVG
ncbi:hypothetical protein BO70DRAFT_407595 [Aspergillus heteromorphus CBS 117.55]|uniref:Trichothecene 3-O-acetyltransferase-like N-terminal domain-containing protein n=1 Tax=Aspergillus heteromorphus CBS 117.55 TaxID=1448321 RepID=A0A317VXS0_9EURO|nr:uncharacterized protein BO70DRAFT_407595 [Aspergillus heteromorphus CBS 117.55]PWY79154.1 hypothetical protein BO70DRAFT_407595 [Aspergillus heteromorphus CBS 117.55]